MTHPTNPSEDTYYKLSEYIWHPMVYQRSVRYRPTAVGAGDACASKDRKKREKHTNFSFTGLMDVKVIGWNVPSKQLLASKSQLSERDFLGQRAVNPIRDPITRCLLQSVTNIQLLEYPIPPPVRPSVRLSACLSRKRCHVFQARTFQPRSG